MTRDKIRAGAFLVALGSTVAVLALLAGPAGAQTSGGATATDGSVASGDAHASRNSTASGDATAVNNSTASGCATATNNSTASGDDCEPDRRIVCPPPSRPVTFPGGKTECIFPERDGDDKKKVVSTGGGGISGGGGAATASTARLALTGSWTAPLAATAALALALGAWLLVATSSRRRTSFLA